MEYLSSNNNIHNECCACTKVGVPVFHSTASDPAHKPEWEALAGSHLVSPEQLRPGLRPNRVVVVDPRGRDMQRWNRVIVLARGVSLAVDPLYLLSICVHDGGPRPPCVYMDARVVVVASVVRTCVDLVHACHVAVRFRLAYVSRESLVVGRGKLVWDARAIAWNYLTAVEGFWFDAFVILPLPQVIYWFVVPILLRQNKIEEMMTLLQILFLLQFLPKVYHCFSLMRAMRKATGYIFGTIWWGFGLNLIAYFLASHASGGYWYMLAVRRIASCLIQQCDVRKCDFSLSCSGDSTHYSCNINSTALAKNSHVCLDVQGHFPYGIYQFALPVMSSNSFAIKLLYSNLWGLMALSTMGNNLEPTSQSLEVLFSIIMVLAGLLLFTLLIGNIQVFLHAVMVRRRKMQLKYRDMEWWMNHRQLPPRLRRRVRKYEHQRWAMMGGEDEMDLIKDLPEGLRRDIKRYVCLDLIKKVQLFHGLDDIILDNICDRVKPVVYSAGEKIVREGDPVKGMTFIVRGRVKRSQNLSKGVVATSTLQPGSFLGDELILWCLRRPFLDRLPSSSAAFTCTRPVEAFGLEADDLKYITDHFRYHFANEGLKRTTRFYSSNWRTWAAVIIQLAWRSYRRRTRPQVSNNALEHDPGDCDRRLRKYAAMFMSLKPHDHLE